MMTGSVENRKMVLFGAGKIGRSFIAQLFSRGGYEVVFVDVNKSLIDEINRRKGYRIVIKGEQTQVLEIGNVRGLYVYDEDKVINEVASAGILATSVGSGGLNGIFPVMAKGIKKRYIDSGMPIDIIIAENMRNADMFFRQQFQNLFPSGFPLEAMVGLVETSIGKMVPIMHREDLENDVLQIFAEPYNTLILNRKGFINEVPAIEGLAPKDNMKAWVDRKLFIHNLGHSASAYLGYLYNHEYVYLWEALAVPEILAFIRATMIQSAEILRSNYPGEFTTDSLNEHIDDLLSRFQNKALGDTIFRVGCDLKRKLGPEDRLAGAINKAILLELPFDRILFSLVCGSYFKAADDLGIMHENDLSFSEIRSKGIVSVLTETCGFDSLKHREVFEMAVHFDEVLANGDLIAFLRTRAWTR